MNQKISRLIFQAILTLTLFSLWAGFALLVINQLFYKDLPGYRIGRLCIWEFIAFVSALIGAQLMIKKWGNIELKVVNDEWKLSLSPKYGLYFSGYFLLALIIGIWQFWLFSQKF